MAFSGNQKTRLGGWGGPRRPYVGFTAKEEAVSRASGGILYMGRQRGFKRRGKK